MSKDAMSIGVFYLDESCSAFFIFYLFFWLNASSLEVFPLNSGVGTGLGEATCMPWIFTMPVFLFPQPAMWKPQWGSSLML